MKVLVTGGAGFWGSHPVDAPLRRGGVWFQPAGPPAAGEGAWR
jgi:hypothetical protein